MPWNLLILPLVAGYYILTHSYFFKFKQQRLARQRLIFESVLLGVAAVVIAYAIRLIYETVFPLSFQAAIYEVFPLKTPYSCTSVCTLLISVLFTEMINLFLKEEKYIKKSIQRVGNEFELMLKSSITEKYLLQFTLNNDKVYIAWVKELPIPSISNYVRVIPAISGYRDDKKNLIFTTHYLSVYSEYIKEGKIRSLDDLKVDLVIDTGSIVTVSFFDNEMYRKFNQLSN